MGIALIKIKLMPSSPEIDLEKIKEDAKIVIENNSGKNCEFAEEPVAFGLKAVMISFEIDENEELEPIEEKLREIENINSAQVVDMRRAFG